jgi:hypothetical protein
MAVFEGIPAMTIFWWGRSGLKLLCYCAHIPASRRSMFTILYWRVWKAMQAYDNNTTIARNPDEYYEGSFTTVSYAVELYR